MNADQEKKERVEFKKWFKSRYPGGVHTLELWMLDGWLARAALKPVWSKNPPKESGSYWWWNEDPDSAPIHIEIMWSGTSGSCFASMGQYGWTRAQDVEEMGGYWMPLETPVVPPEGPV